MLDIRSINFRKYLLVIGIGIIIIGFVIAPYDQFKTNIKYKKVSFLSQNDNITITGNLYLPQNYNSSEFYPAVVLVHGINDRAERFHHAAVEFVHRNFIALSINLRGHANSGGFCTLGDKEAWDIMGAADYLFSNHNISNLGVVGHSMGGMAAIRAAYNDTRFNATVVMGAPVSIDHIFSRTFSEFDVLVQYHYLFSFHINFSDSYEQYIHSSVFWINQTHPKNFFFVLGSLDAAATIQEALLCLYNATGNTSAVENVKYGNFAYGNQTLLQIYPGINHPAEPTTPEIIKDTILWIEGAFNITNGDLALENMVQWNINPFWEPLILIGFVVFIFPCISYISSAILDPKKIKRPKIGISLDPKKKILSLAIYTTVFIGASLITFPIIETLNYASWSPYNIAGLLANLFTIQGIFLAIGFLPIIYFERISYNINWVDIGLNKKIT
ncbi:MAG: alpha/beta hydrolase family protein, partial [Promethearchaeota archaeon]